MDKHAKRVLSGMLIFFSVLGMSYFSGRFVYAGDTNTYGIIVTFQLFFIISYLIGFYCEKCKW